MLPSKLSYHYIVFCLLFSVLCTSFISVKAQSADNRVLGLGLNGSGQLGNGGFESSSIPQLVSGLDNVVQVDGGQNHSIALKASGKVATWGANNHGQLGNGQSGDSNVASVISSLQSVKAVQAGGDFSLALKSDGTVWSWGNDANGELGNGGQNLDVNTPVQVSGLSAIKSISAGCDHALALQSDGSVWAWGSSSNGQVGSGSFDSVNSVPVKLNLTGIIQISAGCLHSLALKNDGTVWAWGNNYFGQLGIGGNETMGMPVQVSGVSSVKSVTAGYYHSLALRSDGSMYSWGNNEKGQLGDGTTNQRETPYLLPNFGDVQSVVAGIYHSLVLKNNGEVWTLGGDYSNFYGFAFGSEGASSYFPSQVTSLSNIDAIGSGFEYVFAIQNAYCFIKDLSPGAGCVQVELNGGTLDLAVPESVVFSSAQIGSEFITVPGVIDPLIVEDATASFNGWQLSMRVTNLSGQTNSADIIPLASNSAASESRFRVTPGVTQQIQGIASDLNFIDDYGYTQNTTSLSGMGADGLSNSFNLASFPTGKGAGKHQKSVDLELDIPPYMRAQNYSGSIVFSLS
jgi:alpha-tubulin suppressor-like RCC1 family protein